MLSQIHGKLLCKIIVEQVLQELSLHAVHVNLGTIEVLENIWDLQREELRKNLKAFGLVLPDDKRKIIIESFKVLIIELIHYTDEIPKVNHSHFISEQLGYDYTYLANIFSEVKGVTIQQFIFVKN